MTAELTACRCALACHKNKAVQIPFTTDEGAELYYPVFRADYSHTYEQLLSAKCGEFFAHLNFRNSFQSIDALTASENQNSKLYFVLLLVLRNHTKRTTAILFSVLDF